MTKAKKEVKEEFLEKRLWKAADKLRKNIDAAMDAIEKENPLREGVLPKVYARQNQSRRAD